MTPELSLSVLVNAMNWDKQEQHHHDSRAHSRREYRLQGSHSGFSSDVGASKAVMGWARCASTRYPRKSVVRFFWGLAAVLMLTLTLQVYALQAGSHMHPAMGVLVLFFSPWIGVAGLASALLVPMVLFVWTTMRTRRACAV